MNAADALFVGLADFFVPRAEHTALIESLVSASWSPDARDNHHIVSTLCRDLQHQHPSSLPESPLRAHYDFVQEITDANSVHEIYEKFASLQIEDAWVQNAKKGLLAGSPTSAGVIFEQLEHTLHYSLKECFDFEYRLSCRFAIHPDFREGIRALIVDKDNQPRWSPGRIVDLQRTEVRKMLAHQK
jgi:enoyl-CoA hydratase/carnithine racemase